MYFFFLESWYKRSNTLCLWLSLDIKVVSLLFFHTLALDLLILCLLEEYCLLRLCLYPLYLNDSFILLWLDWLREVFMYPDWFYFYIMLVFILRALVDCLCLNYVFWMFFILFDRAVIILGSMLCWKQNFWARLVGLSPGLITNVADL